MASQQPPADAGSRVRPMVMRWRIQRGVAILVVVLVALGLTAAFLRSVIPALADQFQAMVRDFPHYMASLQHRSASFRQITDRFHLTAQANTLLARLPGELGGGAVGFTRRTFSTLASAVLVAVLTIYSRGRTGTGSPGSPA